MKITIDSSALTDAVVWAQKSIVARHTQPVMSGVMLSAQDGTLTVSGFDYTSASVSTVAAYVDAPGMCLLPAAVFAGIIKSLPRSKQLTLEVSDRAIIQCGTAKFSTQTMPTIDYPTLPQMPPKVGTVPGDAFTTASAQVTYAASKDDGLPVLTAVHMSVGERLTLTATDRYRLAYSNMDWAGEGDAGLSLLVPSAVVDNVARMNAGEIEVFANTDRVAFRCGNRTTTTALIAGDYPNIMPLFPKDTPNRAKVSVAGLLQVLSRASGITETKAAVKLTFTEKELTVNSGSGDGARGQESIESETDAQGGTAIVCGFNVHYLMESLKTLTTEHVEFGFQLDTRKPALIREPDAHDAQQLVMPVRLDA